MKVVVLLILLAVVIAPLAIAGLWNALIPALFHGPVIRYWQALGLLILCRVLVGGTR